MRCRNMTLGNPLKPAACQNDSVSLQPGGCVTLHIWFLLIRKCLKKVCFGGKATFPTLYRTYTQQCYIKLYPPTVPTTLTFAPLSSLPPCLTSHSGGLWCSQLQHCTDRSTTVLPCLSLQHVWGAQLFNLCPWPQSPRTSSCNSTPTLFSATGIHCVKPEQGAASARRVINECKKMSSRVVLF